MKKYTEEDKELVRLLLQQGMQPRDVAAETGIPKGTISGWKSAWNIRTKKSYKHLYKGTVGEVQQRLIEIMQAAPIISYNYFNSSDSDVPPATVYRKYFGSWEAALEAAGIKQPNSTMKEHKLTRVYLVSFGDFYKIGITQQTINQRLGGRYPSYQVLIELNFDSLIEAKKVEKTWLEKVKPYQYIPKDFPVEGRGFTECFQHTDPLKLLEI